MKPSAKQLWRPFKTQQRGVAAVEFALVAMILFTLLLGIMEFGRLMFTWNSAVEATRRGARLAIVCNMDSSGIKASMQEILPIVSTGDISVSYSPSGCTGATDCESATVAISPNAPAFTYVIPFVNATWKIPEFSTTLTRESLSTGSGLDANPDC